MEDLDNTMTAQARKRRMHQRRAAKQQDAVSSTTCSTPAPRSCKKPRTMMDDHEEASASSSCDEEPVLSGEGTFSKDDLAKIPGVKQQARYVPAVKMTKKELTLWRKEARRVRNRESAAASRQKTQSRITELEGEVGVVTTKYQAALKRIVELEALAATHGSSSQAACWKSPKMMMTAQHEQHSAVSPVLEPHPVSPPLSPRESFSLSSEEEVPMLLNSTHHSSFASNLSRTSATNSSSSSYYHPHQATTLKISRPKACVRIPNRAVVAI